MVQEVKQRKRGRPAGSGKKPVTELRQRRDYRLKPSTRRQIEKGQQLTQTSETAFVEAAIQHYLTFLTEDAHEREQLRARVQNLEHELADAQTAQTRRVIQPSLGVAPPSGVPGASPSARRPTYQIYLKHAPGPCPRLPEGFAYLDLDKSIELRQCPIHRVFARPCAIAIARQRLEDLKGASIGITQIWLDKDGYDLPRDAWRKEGGQWRRDD